MEFKMRTVKCTGKGAHPGNKIQDGFRCNEDSDQNEGNSKYSFYFDINLCSILLGM